MNYDEVRRKIRDNEPFVHGASMRGSLLPGNSYDQYHIYSYDTLIYSSKVTPSGNEHDRWLNPRKYSHTTTVQQNMIRMVKGIV